MILLSELKLTFATHKHLERNGLKTEKDLENLESKVKLECTDCLDTLIALKKEKSED